MGNDITIMLCHHICHLLQCALAAENTLCHQNEACNAVFTRHCTVSPSKCAAQELRLFLHVQYWRKQFTVLMQIIRGMESSMKEDDQEDEVPAEAMQT